jgi:hypothetical protein
VAFGQNLSDLGKNALPNATPGSAVCRDGLGLGVAFGGRRSGQDHADLP